MCIGRTFGGTGSADICPVDSQNSRMCRVSVFVQSVARLSVGWGKGAALHGGRGAWVPSGGKYLPFWNPVLGLLGHFSIALGANPNGNQPAGLIPGKKTLQNLESLDIIVTEEVRDMNKTYCGIKQSNSLIDVVKFLLAIAVVALHCHVDLAALNVIYRLAVPLFFMFSAYFLFGKLCLANDNNESRKIIKAFIVRNLKLYGFWLAIQLPFLISHQSIPYSANFAVGLLKFLRALLFGSTFTGSWYFSALVIGSVLLYFASKFLNEKLILAVSIFAYCACLLFSTYHGVIRNSYAIGWIYTAYSMLFLSLVHGFPVGLIWLSLGKSRVGKSCNRKWMALLSAVSFIGLVVEKFIVERFGWVLVTDCYIMLVPATFGIFQLCRSANWSWKHSVKLRNLSTILYVTHGLAITTLRPLSVQIAKLGMNESVVCFVLVLFICIVIGSIILLLERVKLFRWLRYAH